MPLYKFKPCDKTLLELFLDLLFLLLICSQECTFFATCGWLSYLESMPRGVTLSDPISIARAIPGASRSITSFVACN